MNVQDEVLRVLRLCAETFRQYAEIHQAKMVPGLSAREASAILAKVGRNTDLAQECEAAIAAAETPADVAAACWALLRNGDKIDASRGVFVREETAKAAAARLSGRFHTYEAVALTFENARNAEVVVALSNAMLDDGK